MNCTQNIKAAARQTSDQKMRAAVERALIALGIPCMVVPPAKSCKYKQKHVLHNINKTRGDPEHGDTAREVLEI